MKSVNTGVAICFLVPGHGCTFFPFQHPPLCRWASLKFAWFQPLYCPLRQGMLKSGCLE